jgi:peptidyl-dipeptidase A
MGVGVSRLCCLQNGNNRDPFFQEPPEDAELDVRSVLASSYLYGRPGKNQHGFCLSVGREYPHDVRVLANVRPDAYWMNSMLHEFGHAVYDKHINPKLPYFLRTVAHTCTTEAIALMMGSLAEEPGWFKKVAGVSDNELDDQRLGARRKADGLVFTRWALVVFNFEKALYENPDREDLNSVWWDLVERLQLVDRSPGRDEPDWAAKIHLAIAPIYYHNYVLGHLISAQLRNHLESHVTYGLFYEHEVAGRYLMESFFGPGARENWRDTVLRATGEDLDPDHFVGALR